jgi:GNAT superfamily N-acetyltransferase
VDGYNLMEQFVGTLNNPIYRTRLRAILASGRGVFRQFKDTIRERREIERLWFTFKERRMREIVTEWFNDLREQEGLERLAEIEGETETSALIESDFTFRPARNDELPRILELDLEGFMEAFPATDEATTTVFYDHHRAGVPEPDDPACSVVVTETQGGDFAGFIWTVTRRQDAATVAFVVQIYVMPEFRGFGLARTLFTRCCEDAHDAGVAQISLPLCGAAAELEPNFARYGLERRGVVMGIDLAKWRRGMHS